MFESIVHIDRQQDDSYMIDNKRMFMVCETPDDVCKAVGNVFAPLIRPLLNAGQNIKITITDGTDII